MRDDVSAGGSIGGFGQFLGSQSYGGRGSVGRSSVINRSTFAHSGVNGTESQMPRKSVAAAETDYFKKISIKEYT